MSNMFRREKRRFFKKKGGEAARILEFKGKRR
jgi:hypothetical protein